MNKIIEKWQKLVISAKTLKNIKHIIFILLLSRIYFF